MSFRKVESGRKRYALEEAKGDQGDGEKRRECHRRRQNVLCVYAIAASLAIRQPRSCVQAVSLRLRTQNAYGLCNGRSTMENGREIHITI